MSTQPSLSRIFLSGLGNYPAATAWHFGLTQHPQTGVLRDDYTRMSVGKFGKFGSDDERHDPTAEAFHRLFFYVNQNVRRFSPRRHLLEDHHADTPAAAVG